MARSLLAAQLALAARAALAAPRRAPPPVRPQMMVCGRRTHGPQPEIYRNLSGCDACKAITYAPRGGQRKTDVKRFWYTHAHRLELSSPTCLQLCSKQTSLFLLPKGVSEWLKNTGAQASCGICSVMSETRWIQKRNFRKLKQSCRNWPPRPTLSLSASSKLSINRNKIKQGRSHTGVTVWTSCLQQQNTLAENLPSSRLFFGMPGVRRACFWMSFFHGAQGNRLTAYACKTTGNLRTNSNHAHPAKKYGRDELNPLELLNWKPFSTHSGKVA